MRSSSTPLFLAALMVSVYVQAQSAEKLPVTVQREIDEMTKMCLEMDGKPSKLPGFLAEADLTGDGLPDYVIDQGAFACDGAASLFSGSGGSQMSIYVSASHREPIKAFAAGSFGVKLDRTVTPAMVFITVGGPLCGQKQDKNIGRAGLGFCWRPVVWDQKTKKMQFAPVSEALPVQ